MLMLDQVIQHIQSQETAAVDRLVSLLSIASVSTDPAYTDEVHRAARWCSDTLSEIGLAAEVIATPGHPVVLGRSEEPAGEAADRPTILYYGHYDVQPPDPLDKWDSPPFEPQVRDNMICARGASDDKGQVCCFLEAIRAWQQVAGGLPCRVIVMLEGEEECGSENLAAFIEGHKDALSADVVVISDTTMWGKTVAITYGLRGMAYFDVQLHHSNRDLHSGMYGGVLANPANELTRVLGGLFDEKRRVTVPHFYDDVAAVSDEEGARWDALGFDELADCLSPIGVATPFGEAGYSTLERRWARPSCDINGLYGGYGGAGAKTVIASFVGAKVSFRLAPHQSSQRIAELFEQWLTDQPVHGCRWQIEQLGCAEPALLDIDSPWVAAADRAVQHCTGRRAALIREGATIPVVADFRRILGLDSLLIGFASTTDRIHAPNEKFDLPNFKLGCCTHAALLAELAKGER